MRFASLLVLLAALAAPAHAVEEPTYTVVPCCDLCPQTGNRAAYNTEFLRGMTTLVQGDDGWLFRTDDDLRTAFGPEPDYYAELARFRNALKARGTDLVVVYQPTRGLMHPDKLPKGVRANYKLDLARFSYALTLQRFRNAGLVVPDLTALMREEGDPDAQPYFYNGDHHWTTYGAQRTARIVAETIRKLPSYREVGGKRKFTTERTGVLVKRGGGTLKKAAAQLCGFGFPDQYMDRFATAPEGSSDLFSDEAAPQIALAGTSNSDSAYNFAGFLEEYLEADVLNESVAGGRHDGALLQYLPSPEFQKNPPKILIWEVEPVHNLSQRSFYRQVIPLVSNGCQGGKAIITNRSQVTGAKQDVLFNGGGKVLPLVGRNHVLDLQFSDPDLRDLKATVWYTNGSRELLNLSYSQYVNANGRFVTELRSDGDWGGRTFMSLDVELPKNKSPVNLTAQICAKANDNAPGERQAGNEGGGGQRGATR